MDSPRLVSNKSMTFSQFTDLLYTLTTVAWGEDWGVFTTSYPTTTDSKIKRFPQIIYQLDEMVPGLIGKNTREIKPRYRENIKHDGTSYVVRSQIMDCKVGFTVFAESNESADEMAFAFMDLIDNSKGFLKKNGLEEILFLSLKQINDGSLSKDSNAVRHIEYLVRIEYHSETEVSLIQKLEHEFSIRHEQSSEEGSLPSQMK